MAAQKLVVAVTGASGFVGRALVAQLAADRRIECRAGYRDLPVDPPPGARPFAMGDVATADWTAVLAGADVVVHTVARTHVLDDTAADPLAAYRRINVEGTRRLAQAAAAAGVRRLVYLSSIKVNGEATSVNRPFVESDPPAPGDAYGITKWEAEQALAAIAVETGLETVVLRPPLIYGPGVKGNLRRLIRLVARGMALPLKSVRNRRSMIGLDNLVNGIAAVLEHPAATNRTFLVSDPVDLSTPELIEALAAALGQPARLRSFPPALLAAASTLTGRGAIADRLLGSLRVDSRAIQHAVGWQPKPLDPAEVRRMVETELRSVSSGPITG